MSYKLKITIFLGVLLVGLLSIPLTSVTFEAYANAEPECTYAEYRNWYGACRGELVSLCEGSSECKTTVESS
jgi:hypothetical protein